MTIKTITFGNNSNTDTSDEGISTRRMSAAVLMILAGALIIFTVGFAQGKGGFLHNVAHDARHAATFPCH